MVIELIEAECRVLDAVIAAPTAWQTPEELARELVWTLDETLDVVATLDAMGWLDAWELADGPVVTLSVAAMHRLGVRLVEVGADETPRWARSGELDPVTRRAVGVFRSERMATLDLVADHRPNAEQALVRREEAEQNACDPALTGRSSRREPIVPRPIVLVGVGLTPWPGPAAVDGSTCPACGSAPLPSHAYCIRCDRSGWDVAPVVGRDRVALVVAPADPGSVQKAHRVRSERERKRRQEQRKRRRIAQAKLKRSASTRVLPLWSTPDAA